MVVAYVADTCVNSRRFIEVAAGRMQLIDVTKTPPPPGLTHVPTVVLPDGQTLVGLKAFEYLARELPSVSAPVDTSDLAPFG